MAVKIVRNDIIKMTTEAVVNTANEYPIIGEGVDSAIYEAAGVNYLLPVREEIGRVSEGEAFITPGFNLPAKYIIHAVSPRFIDGESGEEEKLRNCYKNALKIAVDNGIKTISFPLVSTGSYGYPMADGLRIAMEEINCFLLNNELDVYVVVFGDKAASLASRIQPQLESYIDYNYVKKRILHEQRFGSRAAEPLAPGMIGNALESECAYAPRSVYEDNEEDVEAFIGEKDLDKAVAHLADPFGVYFFYLVEKKGLKSSEVQDRAWITKQVYSKINKNKETYHPDKRTALQLSIALELNIDETKDFLARAGYAFSSSDLQDLIFRFFIENGYYDIIDISDALEKYGLKPIITF